WTGWDAAGPYLERARRCASRARAVAMTVAPTRIGMSKWLNPRAKLRLPPEILEPVGGQLGVAHRVLDVLVPKPRLQRPGVVAGIGERVATAVPQHVRMDW